MEKSRKRITAAKVIAAIIVLNGLGISVGGNIAQHIAKRRYPPKYKKIIGFYDKLIDKRIDLMKLEDKIAKILGPEPNPGVRYWELDPKNPEDWKKLLKGFDYSDKSADLEKAGFYDKVDSINEDIEKLEVELLYEEAYQDFKKANRKRIVRRGQMIGAIPPTPLLGAAALRRRKSTKGLPRSNLKHRRRG